MGPLSIIIKSAQIKLKINLVFENFVSKGFSNGFILEIKHMGPLSFENLQKSSCLVFNPITVHNYAAFNCMPVGQTL